MSSPTPRPPAAPNSSSDSDFDISAAFARSASLDKRIGEAVDTVTAATIKPNWIMHRKGAFWYRRRRSGASSGRTLEFVIVDPEVQRRDGGAENELVRGEGGGIVLGLQLAFDHEVLKRALREKGVDMEGIGTGDGGNRKDNDNTEAKADGGGQNDVEGDQGTKGDQGAKDDKGAESAEGNKSVNSELPFAWINITRSDNGEGGKEAIRFRVGERKWQFRCDDSDGSSLREYDGEIEEETLQPMRQERPSDPTREPTTITFVNQTKGPIDLFWIDWEGQAKHYVTVEAGSSNRRPTLTRHVWRVANKETGEAIASFCSRDRESKAVIEEGMTAAKPVDNSTMKKEQRQRDREDEDSDGLRPQGRQTPEAFVKDYNLWVRDADGGETQLSTSGTKENPFHDAFMYARDGRFVEVSQFTREQERQVTLVESSPKCQVQPRLKQFQYLKPGDQVRIDRPRMFDLIEKKEAPTDGSLFQNSYYCDPIGWSVDGKECWSYVNMRGHQVLRVIGMDVYGNVRKIIEETSATFIDYDSKLYYHRIKGEDELIWASERDGWNHLYLYDLKAGKVKNRITSGEWVVRSIDKVDEKKRQIYIRAFGVVKDQDPYYAQLVRVNLDGSGFIILTEGDGTHTWDWSPDRRYFVDTWSRVDLAPQNALRDGESGKIITTLGEGSLEMLEEVGWTRPERFTAPGRDGETTIYGIIIRPSNFNPTKSYPVIEQIYAGPQDFSVPKSFAPLLRQHELGELGFIIVQIDGMGTNWRSKAFQDICYKNLKDAGFPDRIAWMKAAASTRPWMDLTRVGIYGASAGGHNAMAALLWHGDFYKAAAADCGCHDNRVDKLWWNELFMGWPVDKSYEDSSNVVHAHQLKGKLMLLVGELDDNVDPACTMQVVNALNKAEKDYDLVFMPGKGHCVGTSDEYATRRQRDFFVRHILGMEPPDRNKG